jgi:hypothetical protein
MTAPARGGANQRALVLAGVGLAVVVLAVVLSTVVFGGGGGEAPAPVPRSRPAPPSATTTTAGVTPGERPVETFEVFSTKNPFTPLAGTTPAGGPATTAPATSVAGAPPTTAPGATTTTAGGVEPRRAQRVALLEIFEADGRRVANVRVDDTVYERLAPGDTFAVSYKVVSLEDRCGTFLFGDDRFRLCVGEEVLK